VCSLRKELNFIILSLFIWTLCFKVLKRLSKYNASILSASVYLASTLDISDIGSDHYGLFLELDGNSCSHSSNAILLGDVRSIVSRAAGKCYFEAVLSRACAERVILTLLPPDDSSLRRQFKWHGQYLHWRSLCGTLWHIHDSNAWCCLWPKFENDLKSLIECHMFKAITLSLRRIKEQIKFGDCLQRLSTQSFDFAHPI
jgi:hypothetical protein